MSVMSIFKLSTLNVQIYYFLNSYTAANMQEYSIKVFCRAVGRYHLLLRRPQRLISDSLMF
jgi:hypothetical protein